MSWAGLESNWHVGTALMRDDNRRISGMEKDFHLEDHLPILVVIVIFPCYNIAYPPFIQVKSRL